MGSDAPDRVEQTSGATPDGEGLMQGLLSESFSAQVGAFVGTLEDVSLPMGLVINRIQVQGKKLSIQSDRTDGAGPTAGPATGGGSWDGTWDEPASLEVLVSQESLEAFLSSKAPGGLKDFVVTLENGKINVTATLHVLIDMRASAICHLAVEDGSRLVAVLDTAGVMGVGAKNLIQTQLASLNPIFDTSMLPVPCELHDVTVDSGWLRVRGSILPKT